MVEQNRQMMAKKSAGLMGYMKENLKDGGMGLSKGLLGGALVEIQLADQMVQQKVPLMA